MNNENHINIITTRVYAGLVGLLALMGMFTSGLLWGVMNADMAIDTLRVVLFAALFYAGFILKREDVAGSVLMVVGILYVGMGIGGAFNSTLGGMLPSGLTSLDVAFHLLTGIVAISVAAWNTETSRLVHH